MGVGTLVPVADPALLWLCSLFDVALADCYVLRLPTGSISDPGSS